VTFQLVFDRSNQFRDALETAAANPPIGHRKALPNKVRLNLTLDIDCPDYPNKFPD